MSQDAFFYTFHIIAFVCSSLSAIYTFVKLYLFINAPQWQGCFRVCVVVLGFLLKHLVICRVQGYEKVVADVHNSQHCEKVIKMHVQMTIK